MTTESSKTRLHLPDNLNLHDIVRYCWEGANGAAYYKGPFDDPTTDIRLAKTYRVMRIYEIDGGKAILLQHNPNGHHAPTTLLAETYMLTDFRVEIVQPYNVHRSVSRIHLSDGPKMFYFFWED